VIRMTVSVPLTLSDQRALEYVTHRVLDAYEGRDWTVSLVPFLTMPGCMLEVGMDQAFVERRLLDTVSAPELESALRAVTRRRCASNS
jgi:hypothetical protein